MWARFELADVVSLFGAGLLAAAKCTPLQLKVLGKISDCRTASLGGHEEVCDNCGTIRYSYNSCGDRHCPKCQAAKQALWVEDRMNDALDCKYFHIVFTVPEELNQICLLDSDLFYKSLFECIWSVLQQFGYTKYGVESGAICVLHTWGQNLSLHPHIHCIVSSAGLTLAGNLKRITKNDKYLYPVLMLSPTFRSILLKKLKLLLKQSNQLPKYQSLLDDVWKKPWVVYCKPPFGNAQHIVKYLGQYSHRVAIGNHRKRFVKIRYYGILSSKQKDRVSRCR
jgi:hypothetical protein